ncbi:MAG: hypothetical protein HKN76_00160 [Saprospiraceae bacterium]|nr:hypothetical protein [Saprospiraceae bacterium]
MYGALVTINYAIQTTAIPSMVLESNVMLEAFSMLNPSSICWTLEMFAYAVLGVAYWFAASAFQGKGIFKAIRYLMIFNGWASLISILIPVVDPHLLLAPQGLIAYCLWNVLILSIMVLVIRVIRLNLIGTTSISNDVSTDG